MDRQLKRRPMAWIRENFKNLGALRKAAKRAAIDAAAAEGRAEQLADDVGLLEHVAGFERGVPFSEAAETRYGSPAGQVDEWDYAGVVGRAADRTARVYRNCNCPDRFGLDVYDYAKSIYRSNLGFMFPDPEVLRAMARRFVATGRRPTEQDLERAREEKP